MATITWRENPPVKESIEKHIHEFDFHQAVNILEHLNSEAMPLGEGCNPDQEATQIKSHVSFAMPASELHALETKENGKPTLWVNFLSIAGVQGPLPTPYTETIIQRTRQKDTGFRDFLDIFNHRLASFWHRLRKKTTPGVAQIAPETSPIGRTLLQLVGIQQQDILQKTSLNERILLTYHDLLWKRPHSSAGLGRILQTFFKVPVHIEQFQGKWNQVSSKELSYLGEKKGKYNVLGKNMILGKKSWDQTAGLTIHMGPLSWENFCSFLPLNLDNKKERDMSFNKLKDLCYFYAGLDTQISVRLTLNRFEVKPVKLNRQFGLGYNSWIVSTKVHPQHTAIKLSLPLPHA